MSKGLSRRLSKLEREIATIMEQWDCTVVMSFEEFCNRRRSVGYSFAELFDVDFLRGVYQKIVDYIQAGPPNSILEDGWAYIGGKVYQRPLSEAEVKAIGPERVKWAREFLGEFLVSECDG